MGQTVDRSQGLSTGAGISLRSGETEVEKHPPAPGRHVQEELHKRQQVVVVIRCPAQGTAQLPELWGQWASRRAGGAWPAFHPDLPTSPLRGGGGRGGGDIWRVRGWVVEAR